MLVTKRIVHYLLLLFILVTLSEGFDPFTLTGAAIGVAGSALGLWKLDTVIDNTYCKVSECCRKPYLKWDIVGLKYELKHSLYGQHIVQDVLVNAIGAHFDNIEASRKPLVISFHGTSGTGKNFVSDYVATSLYTKGIDSKFVFKFTASDTSKDLADNVKQTIKACPYALFIFDEIEKMPAGVFDSIVALLDHHSALKGYDFTKAIFIFLSNSAGIEIARKLKSMLDAGHYRDETKLGDFERLAELGAYNVIGGLYRSRIIESHVIDHFIPFLPLEPRHVEMCIAKELLTMCPTESSNEDIGKILKEAMTYDDTEHFSNNGCKRISKKVESYCYQLRWKNKNNNGS